MAILKYAPTAEDSNGFNPGDGPNAGLFSTKGPGSPYQNAFNYGGDSGYRRNTDLAEGDPGAEWMGPNGAQQAAGRYQGLGQQWAGMQAPQANYGQANGYLAFGDAARGSQSDALGMMQQAAQGNVPSVAAMQMQQGNNDAMRNQLSAAAGARGAAGMGMAGYGAAQAGGQMASQNIANTGMLRAQEMANARNEYMQGATGMRGQDYGAAQMTGGWAQNQAALQMQQRQLGLQGQLGFEGMGQNVDTAQLQAQMQQQALAQGQWTQQTNLDQHSTDATNPLKTISDASAKQKIQPLPGAADMTGSADGFAKTTVAGSPVADNVGFKAATGAAFLLSDARAKSNAYLAGAADAMKQDMEAKFAAPSAVTRKPQAPGVVSIPEVDLSDPAPVSPLDAAHDAIPAHTFEYKAGIPGVQPGVPQAGVIAQQAQAHPLTAAMVREDPQTGLKALDVPTATSFTLAASSDHNKRIRALESAVGGLNQEYGYGGQKGRLDASRVERDEGDYGPLDYGGEIYRPKEMP